jgi:hypothetical protein
VSEGADAHEIRIGGRVALDWMERANGALSVFRMTNRRVA